LKRSITVPAQASTRRSGAIRRLVLTAAAVLMLPLLAPAPRAEDALAPDAAADANLECAAEPLSGSGPGFSSSRDSSEEAAIAGWLEKAKTVYPEATWETAKDADVACAVQGLYSKCFAQGIPCRPKDGAAADAAAADGAATDGGDAAPAPESDAPKPE